MAVRKQLSVLIANRPGTMAALASTVAGANVNIEALSTVDATEYTLVRLVPSDADKAEEALKGAGYSLYVDEVVAVEVANRPGTLAEAAGKLAREQINIDYCYFSATGDASLIIFKVANPERADAVLGG